MPWFPLVLFTIAMAVLGHTGQLTGRVDGRDATLDWSRAGVFVSVASCNGEWCTGVAYASTHPLSLRQIGYGDTH